MKALFIGGTGTISTAISRQLAAQGIELYLLNRGSRNAELPGSIHFIKADINDEPQVASLIKDMTFDVVCDFIGLFPSRWSVTIVFSRARPGSICTSVLHRPTTRCLQTM